MDFFFGGKVQTREAGRRERTTIQLRLIKKLVQQALVDLEKAWRAVSARETQLSAIGATLNSPWS